MPGIVRGSMATLPRVTAEGTDLTGLDLRHHQVLHSLREHGPVVWLPSIGGWVVLSRQLAISVMRDAATYTVDDPRFSTAQVVGPSMLSLDGAAHRRHREPFAAAFLPAVVTPRDGPLITEQAHRLVRLLRPRGRAELRRELAGPMAVAVAAAALGLDDTPVSALLGWYDLIVAAVNEVSSGGTASREGGEAVSSLAAAVRRAACRPDSLLARIAQQMSDDELVSNAAVFLFGGIETSEGMTSNVLHHLLADPTQLEAVRAQPALVDSAIEESLRLEPAAARVDRYATADVELGGVLIRRRDLVVVSLAAANRDPEHFDEPDRFIVGRSNGRTHLSFATGPHACIGAQLARLETRAVVGAVLEQLPGIELTSPVTTTGVIFRKPVGLHATWHPGG